jgi:hypothetical protein
MQTMQRLTRPSLAVSRSCALPGARDTWPSWHYVSHFQPVSNLNDLRLEDKRYAGQLIFSIAGDTIFS